mmetsp:Transcript_8422/g.16864  ORF Transcript_8422/g.16864 Transcript_8422/m.16864 type:complete len:213 (+) Transcript_8422:859-1497(+)
MYKLSFCSKISKILVCIQHQGHCLNHIQCMRLNNITPHKHNLVRLNKLSVMSHHKVRSRSRSMVLEFFQRSKQYQGCLTLERKCFKRIRPSKHWQHKHRCQSSSLTKHIIFMRRHNRSNSILGRICMVFHPYILNMLGIMPLNVLSFEHIPQTLATRQRQTCLSRHDDVLCSSAMNSTSCVESKKVSPRQFWEKWPPARQAPFRPSQENGTH